MRTKHTLILITTCLSMMGTMMVTAQAQNKPTEGEVARIRKAVSTEILSPFCPGKNLDMCTSPNAAAVRRDIQDLAEQGKTKEEIKASILTRYGEEFKVIEPPMEDNALLLGLLIAGFISAISLLIFITRRKKRPDTKPTIEDTQEPPLDDEEMAYLNRL